VQTPAPCIEIAAGARCCSAITDIGQLVQWGDVPEGERQYGYPLPRLYSGKH
tara:strand:- start:181 stop:336 length:156 start_codon:yes stop_codon:yes gene_type:complete